MSKTIEELGLLLTAHADDLQIYSNGLEEDAVLAFEQTEDLIMEVVYQLYEAYSEHGIPLDADTQKKIVSIKDKIEDIRNSTYENELEYLQNETREVVKNEGKFLYAFWGLLLASTGSGKQVTRLTSEWYDRISKYGIYNGNTLKGMMKDLQESEGKRVRDAIVRGISDGKNLKEVRDLVKHELSKTRRYVRQTVNLAVNGAKNDAAEAFALENGGYLLYSAVLDFYTCDECREYDGTIYKAGNEDVPVLPRHYGCRCHYVPLPDDDERLKELRVKFREYLDSLSEEEQKDRLGDEKFRQWKDGKYQLKDWEIPLNRMSMDELKSSDRANMQ